MKNPVQHWYHQRISAVIMFFLIPFLASVFLFSPVEMQAESLKTISIQVTLFMLFLTSIYHMILGFQIIIDDYIHHKALNCLAKMFIYIKSATVFAYAIYLFYCLLKG